MRPTQDPNAAPPDSALDRATWETLREAAYLGRLQPEGAQLIQELHAQYPEWVEEWSR